MPCGLDMWGTGNYIRRREVAAAAIALDVEDGLVVWKVEPVARSELLCAVY
jgi:hypothetical protein